MSTREGNRNGSGQGCHFGRFAQGKGCGARTVRVVGGSRLCARHWKIFQSIVRDADREAARLDALNAVHCDPAWTSAVGVLVE